MLSYGRAKALMKGQHKLQTISIVISDATEKKLMKNFGIIPNPRFSENYPFFEAFDLPTVSLQRNEQPLFVVTYAKRAEQLKVRIRKTKIIYSLVYKVVLLSLLKFVVKPFLSVEVHV